MGLNYTAWATNWIEGAVPASRWIGLAAFGLIVPLAFAASPLALSVAVATVAIALALSGGTRSVAAR